MTTVPLKTADSPCKYCKSKPIFFKASHAASPWHHSATGFLRVFGRSPSQPTLKKNAVLPPQNLAHNGVTKSV